MEFVNFENVISVTFAILAVASCAAFTFLIRDIVSIHNATRTLLRTNHAPRGFSLTFNSTKRLWRNILTIHSNIRTIESHTQIETEALHLSSSVSSQAYDLQTTAQEVVSVLFRQASPEAKACALLFKEENADCFSIIASRGIPAIRIEEPLCSHLESLSVVDESKWGFFIPEDHSNLDLSTFAISTQLILPLRISKQIRAAVWIGFKKGAAGLNSKRMERLQAFTKHIIGSVESAMQATAQLNLKEQRYKSIVGISHDMQAPGNSALYALQELLEEKQLNLTPDQQVILGYVKEGLDEQYSLLEDLLDFARSESQQLRAQIGAYRLDLLLDPVLKRFSFLAKQKGLQFNFLPTDEIAVVADESHFKRLVSNLLSNSIKYTETGSITVQTSVIGSRIQISVIDTGIGIPKEERPNIFTEFYRANNSTAAQGIGLGLALSKRLAELNDMLLSYTPNKEGGSIFTLSCRCLPAAHLITAVKNNEQRLVESILLVEDDPAVARTTRRYLDGAAESIITVYSFNDAIEILSTTSPTIVISDFNLGDGTALNIIDYLKNNGRSIPTIILTGSSYSLDIGDFSAHKIPISIIQKPTTRERLKNEISLLANYDLKNKAYA